MNSQANQVSLHIPEPDDQIIDLSDQKDLQILVSQAEYLDLKWRVNVFKSLHERAVLREKKLKEQLKEKEAENRALKARLYGKSSEKKTTKKNESQPKAKSPKRPRGQQPGSKGHGRTKRPDLPEKREEINFSEVPRCSECSKAYSPDESEEAEITEVEVKAYKRKIIRQRMKKECSCKGVPNTVTVPMPAKLIKKSPYGVSIWESILLNKFQHCQPTNRLLNDFKELGLPISPGSITGGLRILKELFEPVYNALYHHQITEETLFHNDETRWKVFEHVDGKAGNLWWLWVSRSPSVVYFQIAQSRGASVPVTQFEPMTDRNTKVILVCDRYSAYKSMAKQLPFIILAFCWAHVRRDFLDAEKKHPELEEWVIIWVEKIGELYHINNQRCLEFDETLPIQWQSAPFKELHAQLVEKMEAMALERDEFLKTHNPDDLDLDLDLLTKSKFKILTSLYNHWEGLSVFVEHPQAPMDNNKGEQSIRNPVTGRKNYYGSGSQWSSELAAFMFSIFQTLILWELNSRHWLRDYLTACAENNGQAPEDLSPFLPWEMDETRRTFLTKPPPNPDDTS